jgi:hypothetical protein
MVDNLSITEDVWAIATPIRGRAKRLVFLVLAASIEFGYQTSDIVLPLSRQLDALDPTTPAVARRSVSEARALLDQTRRNPAFAIDERYTASRLEGAARLARAVDQLSIQAASMERAQRLRGARGGRPRRAQTEVATAIRGLLRAASAGDPSAELTLDRITELLKLA